MNIRTALERHPEHAIHGLATLGVIGLLAANFSVCFPVTSAEALAVDREAEALHALVTRSARPTFAHEDLPGAVRAQVASVALPQSLGDWTGYYKTEIDKVYLVNSKGPYDPQSGSHVVPMPDPAIEAKAGSDRVDLAWSFTAHGGPFNPKTMTLTVLRALLRGPDGTPAPGAKEEALASFHAAGDRTYRDAAVEPGCRYAYRLQIVERSAVDKMREVASPAVEAAIALPVRFTLSGVANGVAVIQVEKNFGETLGWRKDSFCARPGEPVGAPQNSMIPGGHGNLDFTTDFVVREIRTDEGARQARGAHDVRLAATVVELVSKRYGRISLVLEK